MKTHFAFGKNGIDVEVPEGFDCQVVRSRTAQALDDVAGALEAALDHPIHSEPLEKLAAGKRTAAISVCDITRPAPNRITLPPLLQRLHTAGIPKEGVTILIATGLHRAALGGHDVPALHSCVAGLPDTQPGPRVGTVLIVALSLTESPDAPGPVSSRR